MSGAARHSKTFYLAGESDVPFAHGEDIRALSLKDRKAVLDNVVLRYGLEKTEPFFGEGRPLFNAVCKLDLEGIVAKRLDGSYEPGRWKILNPDYSQKADRTELFERRYG